MSEPRRNIKRPTASASAEHSEQSSEAFQGLAPGADDYLSTPVGKDRVASCWRVRGMTSGIAMMAVVPDGADLTAVARSGRS
jgi:hypothetical protein